MSFDTIFKKFSAKQGWTAETDTSVLLEMMDELVKDGTVSTEDLEILLEEHDASEDEEEEESEEDYEDEEDLDEDEDEEDEEDEEEAEPA